MRKRELLGLVFLLVGASGVYFSVRQAPPQYVYLTAGRDISPGEILSSSDFTRESLFLSSAGDLYISGDVQISGNRALRAIGRGEVIARGALTEDIQREARDLLTFTVLKAEMPANLKVGDLIDLYFFANPKSNLSEENHTLSKVIPKIRVQAITVDENQLDGHIAISALFEKQIVREVMILLAKSHITISQRFDDYE